MPHGISNIILVGPMGAGKTTVGKILADLLDLEFIDTDHVIEKKTNVSIPWIFEKEGEQGFRAREAQTIDEVCQQHGQVIATGGGSILLKENRNTMRANGCVIYLYAPVAMQLARTHRDKNRPLLKTENPQAKLTELFNIRDPLYREISHYVVATSEGSAKDLAHKIIRLIGLTPVK